MQDRIRGHPPLCASILPAGMPAKGPGTFAREGNGAEHCCSLRGLAAMAREEFASDNTESKNDTSEEAGDTQPIALAEVHDEEDAAMAAARGLLHRPWGVPESIHD